MPPKSKFRESGHLVGGSGGGRGCCRRGGGRDGRGGGGGPVAEAGDVDVPAGDLLAVLVSDGRVAVGEIHCKRRRKERIVNQIAQ